MNGNCNVKTENILTIKYNDYYVKCGGGMKVTGKMGDIIF